MIEVFSLPFMQSALIASAIIGLLCAFLGVFVVLKRMVFLSAALAQISTAGMAFAFLFALDPMWTGLVVALLASALFALATSSGRMPRDSILGISYVGAFALGILFISRAAQGSEELQHLLQGNILTITRGQMYLLLATLVIVGPVHYLFHKEFLFISFDAETARTQGYRTTGWNLMLFLSIGAVVAIGIKISGALLIFAFLVIPAMAALLLFKKLKWIFLTAMLASLLSVLLGLYFSFHLDLPSGPSITAILLFVLLTTLAIKFLHGWVRMQRQRPMR
jgi:ABC-type Mn2+/Zn2+ transport system permease subunit